jgi:hypothetical protein
MPGESRLSHLAAMVIFALLVSVALAFFSRRTLAERIRFALWSLAMFLVLGVGIAWLMYPFSR